MLIFKQSILPLKGQLYFAAFTIIHNEEEAEELLQDCFLKMWHKRSQWPEIENIKAYCLKTVRNAAIDRIRLKQHRLVTVTESGPLTDTRSPQQLIESKEVQQRIRYAIAALPEKQRITFELREYDGNSYQDIAATLQISIEQVKTNIFRARQTLQKTLKDVRY